jgi:uncharacterized Zn ribbon protein
MFKNLYVRKCPNCQKEFRANDPEQKVCYECQRYKQPHRPRKKKKSSTKILTFAEILHIAEVYNKVNGKYLHYGDMVSIIDNTKAERCVCCGAIVPEGRQVCPQCERAVK